MSNPGPDWYENPDGTGGLRWWDGQAWTEHRRAAEPATVTVEDAPALDDYVPMGAYYRPEAVSQKKLSRKEKDRAIRRSNIMAYVGLVLALVSFLFDPVASLSVLAIVFSGIGLARAQAIQGQRVTGRGTAIAGLVIGIVGLVFFFWGISRVMQTFA